MMEYRVTIGHGQESPGQPARRRGKLEAFKAAVITVLVLSVLIGIFLAAFIMGSIIASILLILFALLIVGWLIRRFLMSFRSPRAKVQGGRSRGDDLS
jgi:protein-S-isoprenylcysteine O-methyltransferase Ste14